MPTIPQDPSGGGTSKDRPRLTERELLAGVVENLRGLKNDDRTLDQAISTGEALLEVEPFNTDPEYITIVASCFRRRGGRSDLERAERLLADALSIDPENEAALASLGWVALKKGSYRQAEKNFKNALDHHPNSTFAKVGLAKVFIKTGKVEEAENLLSGLIDGDGETIVLETQAQLSKRQNDFKKAQELLAVALERRPGAVELRHQLASVCIKDGNFDQAREALEEILEDRPTYAPALNLLAHVELLSGNPSEALDNYKEVLERNPQQVFALAGAGVASRRLGMPEEAEEYLGRGLEFRPSDPVMRRELGLAFLDMGRLQPAKALFQDLLGQYPRDPRYIKPLAQVCAQLEENNKAIELFEKAVRLGDRYSRVGLGFVQLRTGDLEGAKLSFLSVLERGGDDTRSMRRSACVGMGKVAYEQSDLVTTRKWFERGLREQPNSTRLQMLLAILDIEEGKDSEAKDRLISIFQSSRKEPEAFVLLAVLVNESAVDPRLLKTLRDQTEPLRKFWEERIEQALSEGRAFITGGDSMLSRVVGRFARSQVFTSPTIPRPIDRTAAKGTRGKPPDGAV